MATYIVKAVILKMGRSCASCRQNYECEVAAESSEDAIAKAKVMCGADMDTHKFKIAMVREV